MAATLSDNATVKYDRRFAGSHVSSKFCLCSGSIERRECWVRATQHTSTSNTFVLADTWACAGRTASALLALGACSSASTTLPTCVGRVFRPASSLRPASSRELLVLGTVHTPSAQQLADVRSVIASAKAGAVVIELDQV